MTAEGGGSRMRLVSEGPYFAQLWETVLLDQRLRPAAKVLYALLQRVAARGGPEAEMPSQAQLGELIGVNRDTVAACLRELASAGHIVRRRRPGLVDEVALVSPRTGDTAAEFARILGAQSLSVERKTGQGDAEKVRNDDPTGRLRKKSATPAENFRNPCGKTPQPRPDSFKEKEESTESPPAIPPKGEERARRTRLPKDWRPSDEERHYAAERGLDPDETALNFYEHWRGTGEYRLDWHLVWQRWCREEVRRREQRSGRAPINDALVQPSPAKPVPAPTPEAQAAQRRRREEAAARDAAQREAAWAEAVARAEQDPGRPPTVTPETWAKALPETRRRLAAR